MISELQKALYKDFQISLNGDIMPIYVRLDTQLEKEFRKKVIDKYGSQKGALEKAVEEAIKLWLESVDNHTQRS